MAAKRTSGENPPEGPQRVRGQSSVVRTGAHDGSWVAVSCGKVTRSWWCCSFMGTTPSTLIVVSTICSIAFVLCQGESGSGASLGACKQDSSVRRCRFLPAIVRGELTPLPLSGRCLTGKAFVMATLRKAPLRRAARVQRRV